jgi:hypothetical protein
MLGLCKSVKSNRAFDATPALKRRTCFEKRKTRTIIPVHTHDKRALEAMPIGGAISELRAQNEFSAHLAALAVTVAATVGITVTACV